VRRGRFHATYLVEAVDASSSVAVIREYIRRIRITGVYWECGADATTEDIVSLVTRHPVFRLTRQVQ